MTFKTDNGVYASIHEAALTDFPEMTLKHTEGCHFKSELASWPDGVKARFAGGTFVTPWPDSDSSQSGRSDKLRPDTESE